MVYVNSKKFACESCIKGHRSSSCHHTDRPLFEIKKKGRPVSQCTKCRELRQSKKFHSKCTCVHEVEAQAVQPLASSSTSKTRRFIPIVPALPNGLRDALTTSPMQPSDSRQRVDSLLNPCDCKSLWKCRCNEIAGPASPGSSPQHADPSDGLDTLARAAAAISCCSPPSPTATPSFSPAQSPRSYRSGTRTRSGSPTTRLSASKRPKHTAPPAAPGPDLAPLLYFTSSPSAPASPMPEFASMPPMSELASLAGSGCTCGVKCACPGCVEHRAPVEEEAEEEEEVEVESVRARTDCADGCGTCVDPSIGSALPDLRGDGPGTSVSFLDRFFARAAALPPPPVHRKMLFDPMDTTVYAPMVGAQPFGFGTVNLPKLECCGGQCNCPDGQCTCRTSCAGCCADSTHSGRSSDIPGGFGHAPHGVSVVMEVRGSCCS